MLDNFDFDGMKEIGFWPKGTRRSDYEAQAKRVCEWFGFETVYEYRAVETTDVGDGVAVVESAGTISEKGEYNLGVSGLIRTLPSEFDCPICTCPQTVNPKNPKKTNGTPHRCTGCKRKLHVIMPLFGGTDLTVTEW